MEETVHSRNCYGDYHLTALCTILAVLAGFKPIAAEPNHFVQAAYDFEPCIKELFSRNDHHFKCLYYVDPKSEVRMHIFYNSADEDSTKKAYMAALYDLNIFEHKQQIAQRLEDIESAYVNGILYGYPEDAIEGYVGEQDWQLARILGQGWLTKHTNKSTKQLVQEFQQAIAREESMPD